LFRRFVVPFLTDDRQEKDFLWGLEFDEKYRVGNRHRDFSPEREDTWRLYLGLPQESDTFGISDHRPSKRSSESVYYFSLPSQELRMLFEFLDGQDLHRRHKDDPGWTPGNSSDEDGPKTYYGQHKMGLYDEAVMGNYTLEEGEDECGHYLSYYDRWDFSPTVGALGRVDMGFIGKPVEIYNRIYFQPGTRIIRDSPTDRPYFETPDGETMELPMKKVENGK
ncbi:MAG: hypothetical protein AAB733_04700, partial [Patescibacteria group bacterium]